MDVGAFAIRAVGNRAFGIGECVLVWEWMWARTRVRAVGNRAGGIGECDRTFGNGCGCDRACGIGECDRTFGNGCGCDRPFSELSAGGDGGAIAFFPLS